MKLARISLPASANDRIAFIAVDMVRAHRLKGGVTKNRNLLLVAYGESQTKKLFGR
jgi:hypothetical protein